MKLGLRSVCVMLTIALALGIFGCAGLAESLKTKLSILAATHSWTKDLNAIPFLAEISDAVGVEVEWQQIRSGWDEKKNTILASGDVPDIFLSAAINSADIAAFTNLFLPLEDLIAEYAPNIQRMFDDSPTLKAMATSMDGHIYGLPSSMPARPNSYNIFHINKTWLDTLGLDMPTTFDEFYEVLKAFKTQDPNGNGKQDEIPFDWGPDRYPGRCLFTAMSMIGAYGRYSEDFTGDYTGALDGKFVYLPATEDYKNLAIYLHKLYSEGLINQEVFTEDYSQWQQKAKDPEFAMVGASMGWSSEDRFSRYADQYVCLMPLAAEQGISPIWPSHPARTKMTVNRAQITTKCADPVTAIKWLDQFYTDDMSIAAYFGSFGLCVEKEGDHYTVVKAPEGMSQDEFKWTNALSDNAPIYVNAELESRLTVTADLVKRVEDDQLYAPYFTDEKSILPILQFTADEESELAIIKTDVNKLADMKWAEWITRGRAEEQWDAYIEQLKLMDLERMEEIYQSRLDEYYANMG